MTSRSSGNGDRIPDVKRAKFYPVTPLEGRCNFKRFFRIERDGSMVERVYLDVSNESHREELICWHYLRHISRHFLTGEVGVKVLGRDDPWDFRLKLSNEDTFNLEITSVADNSKHFEVNSREERFNRWRDRKTLPLHELQKLASFFPDTAVSDILDALKAQGVEASSLVDNPFYGDGTILFLSAIPETTEKLASQLRTAIEKKAQKNQPDKENTILVVDNRTSAYDAPEFFEACEELQPVVAASPFPEIWFYTGYCSDDDGNRAEFSFTPMKVTPAQHKILCRLAEDADEDGRVVW